MYRNWFNELEKGLKLYEIVFLPFVFYTLMSIKVDDTICGQTDLLMCLCFVEAKG